MKTFFRNVFYGVLGLALIPAVLVLILWEKPMWLYLVTAVVLGVFALSTLGPVVSRALFSARRAFLGK